MPTNKATSLKGKILIAMPDMEDSRFHRTIIYICEHSPKGTMGLILNRSMQSMSFIDVLQQVHVLEEDSTVLLPSAANRIMVHKGGPVETGRGFVLHSSDYHLDQVTHQIDEDISLTETLEILKALASGEGPQHAFLALGYAGWSGGQLENEIRQNGWLHTQGSQELVFGNDLDAKYKAALADLGIDLALLSSSAGHA